MSVTLCPVVHRKASSKFARELILCVNNCNRSLDKRWREPNSEPQNVVNLDKTSKLSVANWIIYFGSRKICASVRWIIGNMRDVMQFYATFKE